MATQLARRDDAGRGWALRLDPAPERQLASTEELPTLGEFFSLGRYVRMDPRNTEYVKEFRASLEDWTDSRFLSREQVETAAMFLLYLVNLAEADGWTMDGWSWKESPYLGCLVVKATVAGIPSVVFTNAKTPISGMSIFLRKLDHGLLEWVKDRYRR